MRSLYYPSYWSGIVWVGGRPAVSGKTFINGIILYKWLVSYFNFIGMFSTSRFWMSLMLVDFVSPFRIFKLALGQTMFFFGQPCTGQLKKVQVMQNRTIKVQYNLDWLTPTNNLHRDLSILTVKDIFKLQVIKFVYKQTGNCLPSIFIMYYTTNPLVHRYRTTHA